MPNEDRIQMLVGDLHDRSRHDALHESSVLPEDHASVFAVPLGTGLSERLL